MDPGPQEDPGLRGLHEPRRHDPDETLVVAGRVLRGSAQASRQLTRSRDMSLLEVEGVTLQYKTPRHLVTAAYKVDFAVDQSDRYVILGPSGCGKSTLLKAVGGFMRPVEGTIRIRGTEVSEPGPDRMMVFQEFEQLMPWKTVLGNVLFPMRATGKFPRAAARDRAEAAIETVRLTKFRDAYPHMLSGGMKMRVAIARAMRQELLSLWQQLRFTVLFVTHSIEEAMLIGSRILVLTPHPGRVRAELDADGFGFDTMDRTEFGAMSKRIHRLLFEPEI